MSTPCVCLCVIIFALSTLTSLFAKDCNLNHIAVQPNFDINRYANGTWYEMKWLAPSYIPSHKLFQNYKHTYALRHHGIVTFDVAGSDPYDPSTCFRSSGKMAVTTHPGKLIMYDGGLQIPYWILKTDYTRYALVYGCYNVSSDGGCWGARSWIWSRGHNISTTNMAEVKAVIEEQLICVNISNYLSTEHHRECPPDTDECNAGTDNCDRKANCSNTIGSFTCTCKHGYVGDGTGCSRTNVNKLSPYLVVLAIFGSLLFTAKYV